MGARPPDPNQCLPILVPQMQILPQGTELSGRQARANCCWSGAVELLPALWAVPQGSSSRR